ncbi:DUF6702 family protein [Pontibacter beigongshangensis]|uniref:DUF6702 family protein n=1 Tax=Pontibacter beigongshangensis TaxID=2574733 RepID=UPI001F5151C0|nr:DUF6702 family protein [Pontibacter beigongshangensis]
MKRFAPLLFLCGLFLLSIEGVAHDYHASITDIRYNPKTQRLEVAIKVFMDDLEEALSRKSKAKVVYSNSEQVQQLLQAYLRRHLVFEQEKGKPLQQHFLGSEAETDAVWAYVEVPVPDARRPLLVHNTVLMELFDDQMNIVNINSKGKTNSLLFQQYDREKKVDL